MSVAYMHRQFPGNAGGSPASEVGWKPALPGTSSAIAVDVACRSPYNAPARLGYWLTPSLVAEYEPAYAAHVYLPIFSASSAAMPPRSSPFRWEAATPQARLISSPAGGALPSSALLLCLQRSYLLAPPASDAIVTAAHVCG